MYIIYTLKLIFSTSLYINKLNIQIVNYGNISIILKKTSITYPKALTDNFACPLE